MSDIPGLGSYHRESVSEVVEVTRTGSFALSEPVVESLPVSPTNIKSLDTSTSIDTSTARVMDFIEDTGGTSDTRLEALFSDNYHPAPDSPSLPPTGSPRSTLSEHEYSPHRPLLEQNMLFDIDRKYDPTKPFLAPELLSRRHNSFAAPYANMLAPSITPPSIRRSSSQENVSPAIAQSHSGFQSLRAGHADGLSGMLGAVSRFRSSLSSLELQHDKIQSTEESSWGSRRKSMLSLQEHSYGPSAQRKSSALSFSEDLSASPKRRRSSAVQPQSIGVSLSVHIEEPSAELLASLDETDGRTKEFLSTTPPIHVSADDIPSEDDYLLSGSARELSAAVRSAPPSPVNTECPDDVDYRGGFSPINCDASCPDHYLATDDPISAGASPPPMFLDGEKHEASPASSSSDSYVVENDVQRIPTESTPSRRNSNSGSQKEVQISAKRQSATSQQSESVDGQNDEQITMQKQSVSSHRSLSIGSHVDEQPSNPSLWTASQQVESPMAKDKQRDSLPRKDDSSQTSPSTSLDGVRRVLNRAQLASPETSPFRAKRASKSETTPAPSGLLTCSIVEPELEPLSAIKEQSRPSTLPDLHKLPISPSPPPQTQANQTTKFPPPPSTLPRSSPSQRFASRPLSTTTAGARICNYLTLGPPRAYCHAVCARNKLRCAQHLKATTPKCQYSSVKTKGSTVLRGCKNHAVEGKVGKDGVVKVRCRIHSDLARFG